MIRPYKAEDKEQLLNIFKLNTPVYFDVNEVKDFETYLDRYPGTYLTVEHENAIAGGAGYYVKEDDKSGRITWIFFHPHESGQGLGRQVVEYCLEKLKADERVEKLVVTTSQFAFKFFEKFGYQLVRIEKDYWGKGLDLYLMEQGAIYK
ncbi:MAG: GNAT family N-acetyltransferase [Chitinophagaceae bacterium]